MISLDYVRSFMAVAESGSLSAAARKLGITQPAVTLQLKKLEAACPQPLFVFEGSRKCLSAYGKVFFDSLKEDMGSMVARLERVLIEGNSNAPLRIAGRTEFLLQFLERSSKGLVPGPLEIVPCSSEEASRKVLYREVDMALSYHTPDTPHLIARRAFINKATFVYAKKLLNGEKLTRERLIEWPLLVHQRNDPALIAICRDLNVAPSRLKLNIVAPSWQMLALGVSQMQGIALMPSFFAPREGVEIKTADSLFPNLGGKFDFAYSLLYSRDESAKPRIKKWLKHLAKADGLRIPTPSVQS